MKNIIEVTGIKLRANHGCMEEEAKIGGNYIVDVKCATNFMDSAKTDNLELTIDYCNINKIVEEEMAIRAKLIETVGKRIFDRIEQKYASITALEVKIRKLSPPINGNVDEVSISLSTF